MKVDGVIPVLNVTDVEASLEWFVKLGFSRGFEWRAEGDEVTGFAAVGADGFEIFLCLDGQGGRGEHGTWVFVFVANVDALHETCNREHVEVVVAPRDEPWGVREMHVQHPDGHIIRFGTGLGHD
jgi:catechol 2,3-dioxygenase-like lactoylglutathione lyase family enzyme